MELNGTCKTNCKLPTEMPTLTSPLCMQLTEQVCRDIHTALAKSLLQVTEFNRLTIILPRCSPSGICLNGLLGDSATAGIL